jgi:hypothetical protein
LIFCGKWRTAAKFTFRFPPATFKPLFYRFQLFLGYGGLFRLGIFFDHPLKQIPGIRLIPEFQEGVSLFE